MCDAAQTCLHARPVARPQCDWLPEQSIQLCSPKHNPAIGAERGVSPAACGFRPGDLPTERTSTSVEQLVLGQAIDTSDTSVVYGRSHRRHHRVAATAARSNASRGGRVIMRTRRLVFPKLLVALMIGFGMQACAPAGVLSHPGGATLDVVNHNFADMNVYAISENESPRRLGMAVGLSSTKFTLPSDTFVSGPVHIIAVPIGGFGAAGSGAINVQSGQTIQFTIEPDLNMSSVIVR